MVISVIQQGKGVLHFSGELDSYNLELLGSLAAFSDDSPRREVRIAVDAEERQALGSEGQRFLQRLKEAGYAVSIHPTR
jgi:hypothetical protein